MSFTRDSLVTGYPAIRIRRTRAMPSIPRPTRARRARTGRGPRGLPEGSPVGSRPNLTRSSGGSAPLVREDPPRGRAPSRHPIPEDRRDASERAQEELALLGIFRDEFQGGAHALGGRAEVFDQVPVLDDG